METDTKYADYYGGSESSTLLFRYTVEAGFNDADGIDVVPPLELNSGMIKDEAGNAIAQTGLSFSAVGIG